MDYLRILEKQVQNSYQPGLHTYLIDLYGQINEYLMETPGPFLELGAGTGISSKFLESKQICRTDFLQSATLDVIGGIDAESLPFNDSSFKVVFGIDMLHHVANPIKAIIEAIRVLESNNEEQPNYAVFLEPYISPASYLIYKLFHKEKSQWSMDLKELYNCVSEEPSDGNQAVSKGIIENWNDIRREHDFLSNVVLKVNYLHPVSFFLTGGINRPLGTPKMIIDKFLTMEKRVPSKYRKLIASRVILEFRKT